MTVLLHKTFKKNFEKLPFKVQEQFRERLRIFLNNKFEKTLNNHSVSKVFPDCRSINITGDYRAVFREDSEDMVRFMNIGTHSELYS